MIRSERRGRRARSARRICWDTRGTARYSRHSRQVVEDVECIDRLRPLLLVPVCASLYVCVRVCVSVRAWRSLACVCVACVRAIRICAALGVPEDQVNPLVQVVAHIPARPTGALRCIPKLARPPSSRISSRLIAPCSPCPCLARCYALTRPVPNHPSSPNPRPTHSSPVAAARAVLWRTHGHSRACRCLRTNSCASPCAHGGSWTSPTGSPCDRTEVQPLAGTAVHIACACALMATDAPTGARRAQGCRR
jgi:hypothetical protein